MLDHYKFGKTLGFGSTGEVKFATHKVTREKVAVKIVPRFYPPIEVKGVELSPIASKQASQDIAKEKRVLREASLFNLLHHPYICEMREMVVDYHHYYLVFEHAPENVQLLDYIVTHGRFKERLARKVARQIGSALEYCHMNNIVHRDLKLENISISPSGKIKITDFGLSNLYNPNDHLSTFCGTSYFPAPELLNSAPYTGPEVDIWSFGVVLYVMVCGKVPWDADNPASLQAKLKRGNLKYPTWLSPQCKGLLSRMLQINREKRASLSEVTSHPWMVHGFNGPADNHLPVRQPLDEHKLNRQVIHAMKGLEFGSDQEIEQRLTDILKSDDYLRVLRQWEQQRSPGLGGDDTRKGNEDCSSDCDEDTVQSTSFDDVDHGKKTGTLQQYRKKVFSVFSSPATHDEERQCNLPSPPQKSEPHDPTRGFHPLISMYYLAQEKLERSERVEIQDGANDHRTSYGS